MVGGTDLLSYALLFFIGWVYLPYALFRLSAEVFIDLGRRRDASQLEEIVAACLPAVPLNGAACIVAWLVFKRWIIDWAAIASIFGRDRGAIADYIYAGQIQQPFYYTIILWLVSLGWGCVYGLAARSVCRREGALDGTERDMRTVNSAAESPPAEPSARAPDAEIDTPSGTSQPSATGDVVGSSAVPAVVSPTTVRQSEAVVPVVSIAKKSPPTPYWKRDIVPVVRGLPARARKRWPRSYAHASAWKRRIVNASCIPWNWFLHESVVPLYPWRAQSPSVRIETTDHRQYYAEFRGYEKTTDGRMDALHIANVYRTVAPKASFNVEKISHMYLKWSRVAEMQIIEKVDYKRVESEFDGEKEARKGANILLPIKEHHEPCQATEP